MLRKGSGINKWRIVNWKERSMNRADWEKVKEEGKVRLGV
jgi:hypothetical protein